MTFADAPFATPEFDTLLLDGGRFAWAAGPLTKDSNLCHGPLEMATRSSSSTDAQMIWFGSTARASSP